MKLAILFASCAVLSGRPVLADRPIDYCQTINENFAKGACDDPITGADGIIRETCKDIGEKKICTLADSTIIWGQEILEIETHADGSFMEHTCTTFNSDSSGYSSYCTTLETCAHREGVCEFSVKINNVDCKVKLEECEGGTGSVEGRATGTDSRAPVVDCSFDNDLKWNGCTERRLNPDGMGLHGSFMSVVLADQTPAKDVHSSGVRFFTTSWLVSAAVVAGFILLDS